MSPPLCGVWSVSIIYHLCISTDTDDIEQYRKYQVLDLNRWREKEMNIVSSIIICSLYNWIFHPQHSLLSYSLRLAHNCLTFDFIGTSTDESSDDLCTVQIPTSWRSGELPTWLPVCLIACLSACCPACLPVGPILDDRLKVLKPWKGVLCIHFCVCVCLWTGYRAHLMT